MKFETFSEETKLNVYNGLKLIMEYNNGLC